MTKYEEKQIDAALKIYDRGHFNSFGIYPEHVPIMWNQPSVDYFDLDIFIDVFLGGNDGD
jgi:hypothetical protein